MQVVKKILIIALLTTIAAGLNTPKNPLDNIHINAESMQYDPLKKHANAHGNVKLTYIVNSVPVALTADDLQAQFDDAGKLINVIAENNVEIIYAETHLYAQSCTYDFNKQQSECAGPNVKLIKGKNELRGTKATIDFNTQVFTMHGNEEPQISSIIYPKKENCHKNP